MVRRLAREKKAAFALFPTLVVWGAAEAVFALGLVALERWKGLDYAPAAGASPRSR